MLREERVARIQPGLVDECLKKAPKSIKLYSRNGKACYDVGGKNVYFVPGSTAIRLIDRKTGLAREPLTRDFVDFVRLVEGLEHLKFQSTALIPSDVPKEIADRYRLYIVLCSSNKPIYTGAFTVDGAIDMKDMLAAVAGGEDELAKKPLSLNNLRAHET